MRANLSFTFSWKWLVQVVGLAALYFALAHWGNVTAVAGENVPAIWPAAGLAVAALWWGGYRLAPAIGLGAFIVARLNGVPIPASAGVAFAGMIEPIVTVSLMRRFIRGPGLFDRVGDVFCFLLLAGAAPALAAALGVASLCWGEASQWMDFFGLWLLSWMGDSMGTLIVAPALLVWTWPDRLPWTARMGLEAAGGFALLTISSALIFTGKLTLAGVGFPFLVLPIVVWIAVRLGQRATVSATLLTCAFSVWGTLHGMGPFAQADLSLRVVELFTGVVAMTGLVLSASVTDRTRAQSALWQIEERFRQLVESAKGYAIYMLDAQGCIATWSAEAERIKGYRAEEIIGKPFRTFFTPEEVERGAPEQVLKIAKEEGQARYEGWRVRKDGSRFYVEGIITAMRDESGALSGFSKVAHDVTDRKQAEEALRQNEASFRTLLEAKIQERTAQLQASLFSVEQLLYTIAHDLRAPNRHMQSFAQLLLLEHAASLDGTARDYLDRISAAAARCDELIRDLLEYGRLSHEAIALVPVDLRQAVQAVLHAVAGEIQHRHAHVQFGQDWPRVVADERLLEKILTNLVTNALIYTPTDREPEIAISAESEDGKAVLRVQDNGIGIPTEQIDRVFEPFVRLPNAANAPGTGMGLAIAKKAAERLNGTVGADSTPGKGSCFWLKLQAA